MAFTNQFIIEMRGAKLLEILFDDYVKFKDETEHRKINALFEADGPEDQSDIVAVTFFDERAVIVADRPDGTRFDISAKIQTRFVPSKTGGDFPVTEMLGFFVRETGSAKAKQDESRRAGGREDTQSPKRNTSKKESDSSENGQRRGATTGNERSRNAYRRK